MLDIILYFFIYSVGGFLLETAYIFILTGKYQRRATMLKSPMCVVYGAGAAAMLVSLSWARDSAVLLFCGGFFVCSSVGDIISLVAETACGVRWWDYSNMRVNLGGRVCAVYSLCWGVVSVLFFKFVHPFAEAVVADMNIYLKMWLCVFLSLYFVRDARITYAEMKKFAAGEPSACDRAFPFIKKA